MEVMHSSSKFQTFQPTAVIVGEAVIARVENVRILGVIVDKNLTMNDQLKNVCRSATAALRTIGKIRRYLTKSATQTLIQSFVISSMDFCNSLLYGLPKNNICQLQTLQNAAARIISRAPRRHGTSHLLHDLHWFPIKKRIIFKILLIAFKAQNDMSPAYISDMISCFVPAHTLRSSAQYLLQVPCHSTIFYGNRAFEVAAPTPWNSLPLLVHQAPTRQTFKTLLKTYPFHL